MTQLALDERDANAGRAPEVPSLSARDRVLDGASTLLHAYPNCGQLTVRTRQLVNANSRSMGNSIQDAFVRVRVFLVRDSVFRLRLGLRLRPHRRESG